MVEAPSPAQRREPVFNMPGIVLASCAVLLAVHALSTLASGETRDFVLSEFAFIPARATFALGWEHASLQAAASAIPQDTLVAVIGDGHGRWWTLLTYAFLHGSWTHVGFNCAWLAAFGAPVARRFGSSRFLMIVAVATVAGAVVQFFCDTVSFAPIIGASAAVSGATGAAVRFIFRPVDEPRRSFDRQTMNEAFRLPALSLRQTFTNRMALIFMGFWFAADVLFGVFPTLAGGSDAPIAWQAHIGGFLVGLLAFPLFDRRPAAALPIEREDSADLGPVPPEL